MIRRTIVGADVFLAVSAGAVILVMLITGVLLGLERQPQQHAAERGVMLMNRIGPSASQLYVARSDGADERKLFATASSFSTT